MHNTRIISLAQRQPRAWFCHKDLIANDVENSDGSERLGPDRPWIFSQKSVPCLGITATRPIQTTARRHPKEKEPGRLPRRRQSHEPVIAHAARADAARFAPRFRPSATGDRSRKRFANEENRGATDATRSRSAAGSEPRSPPREAKPAWPRPRAGSAECTLAPLAIGGRSDRLDSSTYRVSSARKPAGLQTNTYSSYETSEKSVQVAPSRQRSPWALKPP